MNDKFCSVCYRNFFNFCSAIVLKFDRPVFNIYDWGTYRLSDVAVVIVFNSTERLILEFMENKTTLRTGKEVIYNSDSLSHTVQIDVAHILEELGYVTVRDQYKRKARNLCK